MIAAFRNSSQLDAPTEEKEETDSGEARAPAPGITGPLEVTAQSVKARASASSCPNPRACLGPVEGAPASRRARQEKRRVRPSAGHSPGSLGIRTGSPTAQEVVSKARQRMTTGAEAESGAQRQISTGPPTLLLAGESPVGQSGS